MYNIAIKISKNERVIAFFVLVAGLVLLLDMFSGFRGMRVHYADIWHHRAVLLALAENPFSPSNPHILSDEGSRSFIPLYVVIAYFASIFDFSANISLGISSIVNFALFILGAKIFARGMGSENYIFLVFLLLFAWFLPPPHVGFHNLRSLAESNSYPAMHSLGLTMIIWGLFLEELKKKNANITKWVIIVTLIAINMITHQITALFCYGALFVFAFVPADGHAVNLLKATGIVVASFLLTLLWPYYNIITVLLAGSNSGWVGVGWFYDAKIVIEICLTSLVSIVFMIFMFKSRLANVLFICAVSIFVGYLGSHFLGITAGHRLLPFWIFFLQVILFVSFEKKLRGKVNATFIDAIKPVFILLIMLLSARNSIAAMKDIFDPILHARDGVEFSNDSTGFYFDVAEKIKLDLPSNAIVVAHEQAAYPIQGFGVPLVSIPRVTPIISDIADRQAATLLFFSPDVSCEQRLEAVKPFGATHAAYPLNGVYKGTNNDYMKVALLEVGETVQYDGLIGIVKLPDQCQVN